MSPRRKDNGARKETAGARAALLEWFRTYRRDLPWRRRPNDPYAVWVSEIMLQQTQVATVIPYFERWMERFPTVQALADAPLDDVLRQWAGLGYYARARNLHRSARQVVEQHGGVIPCDKRLTDLPGVGRYTQGAIRSIAFDQPEPVVDANVARVFCRVYTLDGDPKSAPAQAELWRLAGEWILGEAPGDLNQALMELGAMVCTPAEPGCERCPLLTICKAGNSPDPTSWPQTPPGRATVRVIHASAVIQDGGRFLLAQRPPHGLWGGLWEFPRAVCDAGEPPESCASRAARELAGLDITICAKIGTVKHTVTHHSITLYGFDARCISPVGQNERALRWLLPTEIESLPLSAPQALLLQALKRYMAREATGHPFGSLFEPGLRET